MTTPPAGCRDWVPVSPLLPDDPPRIGDFWLDARLGAAESGVAYTAHDDGRHPPCRQPTPAMVILLSEGAAADAAARDRLAGVVNAMHIDTVLARGGHGQDYGRLGRKFVPDDDDPVAPDDRLVAPWVALAYDGSPAAAAEAERVLDEVQLATLAPQGGPAGPDYQHYWIDKVKPGLARLWPLPWPGRFDRAGWRTILVSWLLMMLLAALAVLIAILIFRNQPPQTPPTPTGGSGSPPPQSQSGSPSPQSGSPSAASPARRPAVPRAGSRVASPAHPRPRASSRARRRPPPAGPSPVVANPLRPTPARRAAPRRLAAVAVRGSGVRTPELIVTDLDGTFLSPDGTVSAENAAAVKAAQEADIPVVFATGRPVRWLEVIADLPGAHPMVIASNGAVLYDAGPTR